MPPERGQVFSFELELGSVGSSSSRTTSITRQYYLLLVISTASPPSAITSLASNKVLLKMVSTVPMCLSSASLLLLIVIGVVSAGQGGLSEDSFTFAAPAAPAAAAAAAAAAAVLGNVDQRPRFIITARALEEYPVDSGQSQESTEQNDYQDHDPNNSQSLEQSAQQSATDASEISEVVHINMADPDAETSTAPKATPTTLQTTTTTTTTTSSPKAATTVQSTTTSRSGHLSVSSSLGAGGHVPVTEPSADLVSPRSMPVVVSRPAIPVVVVTAQPGQQIRSLLSHTVATPSGSNATDALVRNFFVRNADFNTSSSSVHVTHARADAPIKSDAELSYGRLRSPVERPYGSLFGRPTRTSSVRLPVNNSAPVTTLASVGSQRFPGAAARPAVVDLASIVTEGYDALLDDLSWPKSDRWEKEKTAKMPANMARVSSVEAECQNDFMKIRIRFNGSFSGLIYSSGFAYDQQCVYINGTGRDYYEFYIQLNRCGSIGGSNHNLDSRKQPTKNFMWNTLSIQYSALIEEEWDEHYKVTCEYGFDYWKTVSFPFLNVEVATGNPLTFTLKAPECHMEIRQGYASTGSRISGPVRVGDPLTLMIYMRSQLDGFDVIVNDCYAHNGANKRIQLIDNNGCPVNEKLISRFRGTWTDSGLYETQVFAYMKAFRFTGSPSLYIECDVRMCHGHCPIQPCYWRNTRHLSKRQAIEDNEPVANSTSENISLFQALQVLGDDEEPAAAILEQQSKHVIVQPDKVCIKSNLLGAAIGLTSLLYVLLALLSCLMCIRLRRFQHWHLQNETYHRNYASDTSVHSNKRVLY